VGEADGIRELAVQGKRDIGINSGVRPTKGGNPIGQATFVGRYLFCRVVDLRKGNFVRWILGAGTGVFATTVYDEKRSGTRLIYRSLYSSLIEPQAGWEQTISYATGVVQMGWIDRHKGTMRLQEMYTKGSIIETITAT